MRDILFYDSIFLLKIKYCLFKANLLLVNQVKGGGEGGSSIPREPSNSEKNRHLAF